MAGTHLSVPAREGSSKIHASLHTLNSQLKHKRGNIRPSSIATTPPLMTLVKFFLSTLRVFLSACGKARFAGNNSWTIANKCNTAATAQEQQNVEIY